MVFMQINGISKSLTAKIKDNNLMALIVLWLNDARESSKQYTDWLGSATKNDVEEKTGLDINDLAKSKLEEKR